MSSRRAVPLEADRPIPETSPDPEQQVAETEQRRRLEVLLGALPEIDRAIVSQFYFAGVPWQVIAEDRDLTPTQFRLRKNRALARMRRLAN